MRLTASRIMLAPWPVFQSLVAGQRTLASASMSDEVDEGIGVQLGAAGVVRAHAEQLDGAQLGFAQGLDFRAAAGDATAP